MLDVKKFGLFNLIFVIMKVTNVIIRNTELGRRLDCRLDGRNATFWSKFSQDLILSGAVSTDMFKETRDIFVAQRAHNLMQTGTLYNESK